jgi:hypothetical protein
MNGIRGSIHPPRAHLPAPTLLQNHPSKHQLKIPHSTGSDKMSNASVFPCFAYLPAATVPTSDLDAQLRAARWAASANSKLAEFYHGEWLSVVAKYNHLKDACGYKFLFFTSLAENRRTIKEIAEKDMAPGMRQCLKRVIRIQQGLQKWGRLVKERIEEEKKQHAQCKTLERKIAEKNAE